MCSADMKRAPLTLLPCTPLVGASSLGLGSLSYVPLSQPPVTSMASLITSEPPSTQARPLRRASRHQHITGHVKQSGGPVFQPRSPAPPPPPHNREWGLTDGRPAFFIYLGPCVVFLGYFAFTIGYIDLRNIFEGCECTRCRVIRTAFVR